MTPRNLCRQDKSKSSSVTTRAAGPCPPPTSGCRWWSGLTVLWWLWSGVPPPGRYHLNIKAWRKSTSHRDYCHQDSRTGGELLTWTLAAIWAGERRRRHELGPGWWGLRPGCGQAAQAPGVAVVILFDLSVIVARPGGLRIKLGKLTHTCFTYTAIVILIRSHDTGLLQYHKWIL